jgi:hypothetical protein
VSAVNLVAVEPAPATTTANLTCDTVAEFAGFVRAAEVPGNSSTGTSLVGTVVQANLQPTPDLPNGLTFQTTADDSGAFSLLLPYGGYVNVYTPPSGSGQACQIEVASQITINSSNAALFGSHAVTLPTPFTLSGVLSVGTTGNPIAAQIDAYEIVGSTAIPVGSAVTGSDGVYSIVLPTPG